MATKEKLLDLLLKKPGHFLSGEALAETLGVSRAAVWKAVKALQSGGHTIEAVTNKGYCLRVFPDILDPDRIISLVSGDFLKIHHYASLPSANSFLKDRANEGAPEGTLVIADSQTQGRGRMGRSFFSPPDTGLYLSLLLRPRDLNPAQSLQITTMAASALCLAIEEMTKVRPQIKWVNDIYVDGLKVAGILTEASFSMESGKIDYAVLGLGLNLYPPAESFPRELAAIAGALVEHPAADLKNRLTAGFLNHFYDFYQGKKFAEATEIYRSHSLLTGKQVLVGENALPAKVLDITADCRLLVEYADGSREALSYGEVSIVNQ